MRLILLGNGGLADEIQDLAEDLGHEVVGRLTTDTLEIISIIQHEGIIFAVGSPKTKKIFWDALDGFRYSNKWATLISPSARIGRGCSVSSGCVIQHGVVLTTNVRVGNHTLVNLNVTIGHSASIGEFCTINPGANISGDVSIADNVLVGTGAQVLEKLCIGPRATIGAGAVVTNIVPSGVIAKGIPAKW
jgi:sugar O-acyltransferase (sialic acid O-acetyltransferase NeuD family)